MVAEAHKLSVLDDNPRVAAGISINFKDKI
jgi:hypothetical protein